MSNEKVKPSLRLRLICGVWVVENVKICRPAVANGLSAQESRECRIAIKISRGELRPSTNNLYKSVG